MDFVKNLTGNGNNNNDSKIGQAPIPTGDVSRAQSGGFLGGLGERFNSAAGGGAEGEKREDLLDKGMFCFVGVMCCACIVLCYDEW